MDCSVVFSELISLSQVLEQMISEQENLLNTQQQQQSEPYQTTEFDRVSTASDTHQQTLDLPVVQDLLVEEGRVGGETGGSLADTTVTSELETMEDDVITPQPSFPFDVVDGML